MNKINKIVYVILFITIISLGIVSNAKSIFATPITEDFTDEVVISEICPDFNKDDIVDDNDLDVFNEAFGSRCNRKYDSNADIDKDKDVDATDQVLFNKAFGRYINDSNYNPKADYDSDGDVDGSDLAIFSKAYSSAFGSVCNINYNRNTDFDNDGDVDGSDLTFFSKYYGNKVDDKCNIIFESNSSIGSIGITQKESTGNTPEVNADIKTEEVQPGSSSEEGIPQVGTDNEVEVQRTPEVKSEPSIGGDKLSSKITSDFCDAMNPCSDGLQCIKFPDVGLRCAKPDPCSYYECPEGTTCSLAMSYPVQLICSGSCEGDECEKAVSYDIVTHTEIITKDNKVEEVSIKKVKGASRGTLTVKGISTEYSQEVDVVNSKLVMRTSSGKESLINVMPEEALDLAGGSEKVKKIELKEELEKPTYSINSKKRERLLFLIPVSLEIETKINAENGDVISVKKPWWSFLVW
jgi:hypothetical protein